MRMKTRSLFTDLIAFFGALAVALAPYWRWLVFCLVLLIVLPLPFLVKNFFVFQLTLAMVYAIAILGLNLLTGFNGQFSLGHSAFYAIGAYTAAILMDQYDVAYYWTLPIAGIVCFVAGFLFGLPALRLEGIYLALATFALAVAMPQILKLSPLEHWTGGVQGIVIIKPNAPFGLPLNPDQWLYFFTFAVDARALSLRLQSRQQPHRPRHDGDPRQSGRRASAMGVNLSLYKSLTFGVSALYTGDRRRARRNRRAVRGARQLHLRSLDRAVRRACGRRRRLDRRRIVRWHGSCCSCRTSPSRSPRALPARSMV